jgi:uncharacterized circularly permuted ATP-grasp superfamily protein/uncharacterized alpha-E superfamily protein
VLERLGYLPSDGRYDEAVAADGRMRPGWARVAAALEDPRPGALLERQRQAERLLDAEGAGHLVHELAYERSTALTVQEQPGGLLLPPADRSLSDSRPWRLDPLPLVLDHAEFAALADAARQRVRAIEALLADVYGTRRLVREGVLPAPKLFATTGMRTTTATRAPGRWIVHAAVDLVRAADGRWKVVQDLVDAPSGLGYSLLNRSVMARVLPDAYRTAGAASIAEFATTLRQALAAHAPAGRRSPRTIVLTGGPGHPTYIEHSYLAMQMGFHLAEGGDLVVRKNRLWLRSLSGLEPVDVVYRRLEDAALDPLEPHIQGAHGVPAITWAAQHGGVALANGFGAKVAEEPSVMAVLPQAAQVLLGERLQLESYVEGEPLASAPTYSGARLDMVVPVPVTLRLQLAVGPEGIAVLSGGVGRVLTATDHPSRPTAQLVKDVWVVGGEPTPIRVVSRSAPPQVDFGSSVPKRAADALYWMGRAAERAEYGARTLRVLGGQLDEDPSLAVLGDGGWARGALALLRAAQPSGTAPGESLLAGLPFAERIRHDMLEVQTAVAGQIATLAQEATSVREYLSVTTGRVLGRLMRLRANLMGADAAVDDLDVILVDLAALAGLAMESTVRGPAWRFLDLGRRVERSVVLLGTLEAAAGLAVEPLTFQPLVEALLQVNESLVAYRRQYRSDVELSAVLELLVHDDANPRSLTFQLDRLREHMASLAWPEGSELVHDASLGALVPLDDVVSGGRRLSVDSAVLGARGPLLALAQAVTARWFADPVNPMAIGAT